MTLILKFNLDMVKMYLYTKNEVPSCSGSEVIAWTDTQTDTQPHEQADWPEWNYYLSTYEDDKNPHSPQTIAIYGPKW